MSQKTKNEAELEIKNIGTILYRFGTAKIVGILLVVTNKMIELVIKSLSKFEKHPSLTSQSCSTAQKIWKVNFLFDF